MTDLFFPDVPIAKLAPRIIDASGRFSSPLIGTSRTITRPGDRWGFRVDLQNLFNVDRARFEAVLSALRGGANRMLFPMTVGSAARGSFPDNELLPNGTFAAGQGSFTTQALNSLDVRDQVARSTRLYNDNTQNSSVSPATPNLALTQYLPYCVRFFVRQGRGRASGVSLFSVSGADGLTGSLVASPTWLTNYSQGFGLLRGVRVPEATGNYTFGVFDPSPTGQLAGDYYDTLFGSVVQCALVDNGANMLTFSDAFDNAAWSKVRCSATAAATMAPDGTTTGESIVEDTTASNTHFLQGAAITLPSGQCDFAFTVAVKEGTGATRWLCVQLFDSVGANGTSAWFNPSTGALGTTAAGASFSAARSYIQSLGNGWYQVTLVARKTSANTAFAAQLVMATGSGNQNYTGDGSSNLYLWRATFAQSSVPVRLVQSTSSAVAAAPQVGSSLYIKGLPPSTNGLLLPGDWFEMNLEPKKVFAELNSDASGLGYAVFTPPLRNSPADNDPFIVGSPMGRFIASANENGWEVEPGLYSSSSLDLVEAP